MPQPNCQYTTRYCWEADKVKTLIRLRAELSPLFTGKRNASKFAWAAVERELNVPLPLSKIIKKWNNLLQEYKAIKLSEEPKRREWPFFNLMDVYFSDQVNDPTLRLFSSTKTLGSDTLDFKLEDDPIMASAIDAASGGSLMDISDMMHETQSDKASENNYGDYGPNEVQNNISSSNNNNNNNNNNHNNNNNNSSNNNNNNINNNNENSNNNNNYTHLDKQRYYEEKIAMAAATAAAAASAAAAAAKHNLSSTPNYMHQHHNIDQYLLSWNNFHGNMCKGFHNLQKDEKMVDVTIAAGGKIFKAHKLVLSVCSPYFQKIFLEHPSTHPILFMTDVNSNHMAGLLDFMYSGQVNVKYEDLPKFLKVAEAMQIKGLHSESTTDIEESKASLPIVATKEPKPSPYQITNNNNNNNNSSNIPILNLAKESNFREHIRPKPHGQNQDLNNCNNNNNNSSINNNNLSVNNNNIVSSNNNNNNSNSIQSKYVIHQTNSSNKILDNQKYHKYFSKRKMIAQYEHEMQNDKRNKMNSTPSLEDLRRKSSASPINLNNNNNNSSVNNNNLITNNNNNDGEPIMLNLSQKIKVEPDIMLHQDDESDGNTTGNEYHMADLSKNKKHSSPLERLSLKLQGESVDSRNIGAVCS